MNGLMTCKNSILQMKDESRKFSSNNRLSFTSKPGKISTARLAGVVSPTIPPRQL
ncbi:1001_t:CDS:2 [Entrophospora sp. SA101]|nr:1001_t:CDS:2 [Entrophospora sp. SA101]